MNRLNVRDLVRGVFWDKLGEPAFTRHGDEDCPECRAPVGARHLDGCSGQFHESAVGTAVTEEADR